MAFQAVTYSLPLPRLQSNWPVFGVPSFVRLHEYKPQKTQCLRSMFKKKSSGYESEDVINLKWNTDDSKEESGSAVKDTEDNKKTRNAKTLKEDGSLEEMIKLLLVEAAAQKQMIVDLQRKVAPLSELTAAQEQMTVDLQTSVSPSSELTDAKDQRILELQRKVEQLEFNAAQQQMIEDLQKKIAQLELDTEFKSNVKTPPTEIQAQSKSERKIPPTEIHAQSKSKTKTPPAKIHVQSESKMTTPPAENHVFGDGETDEQRQRTSFLASSDKEEPTGVNDGYAMAAMNAMQKMQLDLNAESKPKTKTPPTENHVSGDSKTDEQPQRTSFPASSDKEEPTGVNDDYAMAAMQKMQLDLNFESKSKTKTPPAENHVSGDSKTDEQRQRTSFPVSSDKEEPTGVNDDYAMAAMNALQRMLLDLNCSETDEQRQRTSLVYFPASSDKEEPTGVNDDYAMAAMKALQRLKLDLNFESKSKMGTSLKTPHTESRILSDDETDEEELLSYEEDFSSYEDESGFKGDNYTMAVMNVLLRTQMEKNAESKSKMETPLKTPQTKVQLSDGEADEEEHSSDIDEQRERTQLVNFSASSDEEKHSGY